MAKLNRQLQRLLYTVRTAVAPMQLANYQMDYGQVNSVFRTIYNTRRHSLWKETYTAKCIVTVVEPVVGIKLDKKSTNITIGKSKTLTATVKPSNATNKDVVWRSSNPLVARVTQSGNVQALTEGKATITCTTVDGAFKATCTVNCIIPVDAVTLKDNAVSLKKGSSKSLEAMVILP